VSYFDRFAIRPRGGKIALEPSAFLSSARGGRPRRDDTGGFRPRHSLRERRPRDFKRGLPYAPQAERYRETPPAPGLAPRLQSVCESRRRDRLPEEAISEGARHVLSEAPVWLESLGRLFAKATPRPKAAGPDAGAAQEELTGLRGKLGHYRESCQLSAGNGSGPLIVPGAASGKLIAFRW
jgi:hypothetical protein